jgi:anti-sigma regulatory factor (Ser/Thr protein kinase)
VIEESVTRPSSSEHFGHRMLPYRTTSDFVAGVASFVNEGLSAGQRVMVAIPAPKIAPLRSALGVDALGVYFADMTELGRNPNRIIPAVTEFVRERAGRPSWFVSEPIWPGRSSAEVAEATRHEALLNIALAPFALSVLCAYDIEALPGRTIHDAWRTHPEVLHDGASIASGSYADPSAVYASNEWPLDPPPLARDVSTIEFDDPAAVRRHVRRHGLDAGLDEDRVDDLVLAVNEIASNSIQHGGGHGVLRIWRDHAQGIVCDVSDSGQITNPLVGCHPPGSELEPTGLWLVNQLCDLVEIRSGPDGTCVRIRLRPA